MRIVLLPSNYAPAIGGIEEVTRQLAKCLRASGDEVEVWTHRHPEVLPSVEVIDGVRVRRFRFPLPASRAGSLVRWPGAAGATQLAMAHAIRQFRPDLLHVHGYSGNGVHATAAAFARQLPLVVTLHGETSTDDHHIYERSTSLRAGLRWGLRRAAAVTAPSQFVLDDARRFGLPAALGQVILNGVDLSEPVGLAPFPVPFPRFVLAVGRLVPNKGFDLLLRAFTPLAESRPGLGLVIAGDGPGRGGLVALADELGITERVLLTGWLGRDEVAAVMTRAEVFALTSRVESFGVVLLEAMRAGVPAVATSCGGVGEWAKDGVSALLVDPTDTAQVTAALGRVLDDPHVAGTLAKGGLDLVTDFEWSAVSDRYRALYTELLSA